MSKIVYNRCYGGFGISPAGILRYAEIKGIADSKSISMYNISRHDPALVQVVEELGDRASGDCANLKVADVPDGTRYRIDEYDGNERVMTVDDYDWSVAGDAP
jgi:hypothetical protein